MAPDSPPASPPRAATRLLLLLLPADERDEVVGDLHEVHTELVGRRGRLRAHLWYWRQALTAPVWLWRHRIPRWEEGTMTTLGIRDFRHALRGFRRDPLFTAVTLLTLGLGIGASTAVYSV
ncbi:MAG: permease prefix domain 2-containing transporter, partial [Gemmatimonadota bacterium]